MTAFKQGKRLVRTGITATVLLTANSVGFLATTRLYELFSQFVFEAGQLSWDHSGILLLVLGASALRSIRKRRSRFLQREVSPQQVIASPSSFDGDSAVLAKPEDDHVYG